jgi:hypothetical protein
MVSIWLTKVKAAKISSGKFGHEKNRLRKAKPVFIKSSGLERLLPVLLDAGGPQACQAVLVDGELPGQELVHRQRVAAASLLEGEQAAANRGNDFGLTADNPPFGPGRGQIRNC